MVRQLRINAATAFPSAVANVPSEIWREIFKLVSPPNGVGITPQAICQEPWTLGQVCRYWRAIVKAFPDLWDVLDLEMRASGPDFVLGLVDFQRVVEIFHVLQPRIVGRPVRITFHDIYKGWRPGMQTILDCFFDPNLKIKPAIPWKQITHIQLSYRFHARNVNELLRRCHKLERLEACDVWISSPLSPMQIQHNGLREFRLSPSVYDSIIEIDVVKNLVFPKLERLEVISGNERQGVSSVLQMLQGSRCALKALCVENLRYGDPGRNVESLLDVAPDLEELVLEGDITADLIDTCTARLPHLEKLVVRCTPFTGEPFEVAMQPPLSAILDAAITLPQLRNIEVEACVPEHMWPARDQLQRVDMLRSDGLTVLLQYTQPPGTDTSIIPPVLFLRAQSNPGSESESESGSGSDTDSSSEYYSSDPEWE
ncbi:hypothetical protein VNI00_016867 [Paramarasmius palmivorus]|uniref:F-box domain-containing protein n=1 Tax=Paramarasmius palmivorus TaxID=297713 RepID=A0AAW0B9X2_9AGAR